MSCDHTILDLKYSAIDFQSVLMYSSTDIYCQACVVFSVMLICYTPTPHVFF